MANFKLKSAISSLIIATVATCIILVVIGMAAVNSDPDETWSGWVQAVGSVAAIMAGWIVVLWQQEKSEAARREERQVLAAAFGINLLPKLRELRIDLDNTIEAVTKSIEKKPDPNASVSYEEVDVSFHHVQFIREHWQTLGQLEGDIVRSLAAATSFYALAHSFYDPEYDVDETITDDNGRRWFTITLRNRMRALEYRGALQLALKQVNVAIDGLSIARHGEPETIVELSATDLQAEK